uniref:Growth hormone releasing hormone receptor b n=1 Tax=Hippocampus comes TaxID=109280 RepID=A0A3Q2XJZ6_HIPCM
MKEAPRGRCRTNGSTLAFRCRLPPIRRSAISIRHLDSWPFHPDGKVKWRANPSAARMSGRSSTAGVALGQLVPEARRLPEGISAARSPFFFLLCLGIQTTYFSNFKQVYTAGYATSLVSLISAVFVFAFHCTRNYIHMNLFFSFILRASAVFIKDEILFSNQDLDHCFMSTTSCKSAVAFFQFSILANYFWLLVEGMYLQTLLALTFVFQKKYFWWYVLIGWGEYVFFGFVFLPTAAHHVAHVAFVWWIIKAPITLSLLVSYAGGGRAGVARLAKSTLLLIPLFGMHYMVFAFLPENTGAEARLFIELGLGSFQGFVVAFLYCFLNGEVSDLETRTSRRKIKKWMQNRPFGFRSRSFCSPSMSRGLCPSGFRSATGNRGHGEPGSPKDPVK